jgi:hypothetical protein
LHSGACVWLSAAANKRLQLAAAALVAVPGRTADGRRSGS